jgi:Co/Zn/Cd efflux system component
MANLERAYQCDKQSHPPSPEHSRGHTHDVIDPPILTSKRGVWAVKWSLIRLMATDILQVVIVYYSGSVALLADTIHNVGDALTAVPLWLAFRMGARRSRRSVSPTGMDGCHCNRHSFWRCSSGPRIN